MFKIILLKDSVEEIIIVTDNNQEATSKFNLCTRERFNSAARLFMYFNKFLTKEYVLDISHKGNRYLVNENPSEFFPVWTASEVYKILCNCGMTETKTTINNFINAHFTHGLEYVKSDRVFIVYEIGLTKLFENYVKKVK